METERTYIIPFSENHLDGCLKMYSEPDSNKYIAPLLNKSYEERINFLRGKIDVNKLRPEFWSVFLKGNDSFLGTVNLTRMPFGEGYHVGCHLKGDYWKMGFGKELVAAVLKEAHLNFNLTLVYALCEEGNKASFKMLISLGFLPHSEWVEEVKVLVLKKSI